MSGWEVLREVAISVLCLAVLIFIGYIIIRAVAA